MGRGGGLWKATDWTSTMQTNLIASGSSFKFCKFSGLDVMPPPLALLLLLEKFVLSCAWVTEYSLEELLLFPEGTASASSVISSIVNSMKWEQEIRIYKILNTKQKIHLSSGVKNDEKSKPSTMLHKRITYFLVHDSHLLYPVFL